MTKKIFRSIFIVAAAVLFSCLVIFFGVLYNHFSAIEEGQLRTNAGLVEYGLEKEGLTYLENLNDTDMRITWIADDGTVIFDSERDAKSMDNHKNREEVKEAFQTGSGQSDRYSATLMEKTIYYAKLLDDGTVLRLSRSHDSVLSLVYGMIQPILIILIAALIISGILATRLTKRIVGPLNKINLDDPLENDVYDELSPLLTTIEKQHRQIDMQMKQLERRQNEYRAVTENMNEGLVLLGKEERILSINKSAKEFFSATDECLGMDFITIERGKEIDTAVNTALDDGSCELTLERNSREYQLNISRIEDNGLVTGIVILIFDITDRVYAERNRREFTANVSHELKTPLQAIMGSAELLQSGLVREEDKPEFIGRIRSESSRLVALIEDIIHLSQLDEHVELPTEDIDLFEKAKEEVRILTPVADEKNISISLHGDAAVVEAVPQLVHEIIYNLCDNAIKYNVKGGSVDITVGSDKSKGWILVEDTGIGIAREHLNRIFERFYRVDKSHSKETGGTGLGLSIVKHAIETMNGEIKIESTEGKGTSIQVFLPR